MTPVAAPVPTPINKMNNNCRSRSSVGRALDSVTEGWLEIDKHYSLVWWQHTSWFQKSGVRDATGARCLSSLLAGMVTVGGRP